MQRLLVVTLDLTAAELDAFSTRLFDVLQKRFGQSVRTAEADLCLNALNQLTSNKTAFCRIATDRLAGLLRTEIDAMDAGGTGESNQSEQDLSLVTFDEMENKVMLANVCQAIDHGNEELLAGLNLRLARLLERDDLTLAQNPFRPALFLQAIHDAWCMFDALPESRELMLRLLQPEVFLQLQPVLRALNDALIANGIDLDPKQKYRREKSDAGPRQEQGERQDEKRDASPYQKLQRWLTAAAKTEIGVGHWRPVPRDRSSRTVGATIAPELYGYLNAKQRQLPQPIASADEGGVPVDAAILREVKNQAPHGSLSAFDENTIELLARIFDFIFVQQDIPADFKKLIGRLQIPLLKAALIDRNFFFQEAHPARRLVEQLAKSGAVWNQERGHDDPLYKMAEQIVDRVQQDFDRQIDLFSDVVSDLESFLELEDKALEADLSDPIDEARRQEKLRQARQWAEEDVAQRIATGEVAGFVETFLEDQWTRILTLAHSVEETRPEALTQARKAMDDLIWSIKPKSSPEERKALVTRLPAMLSMMNAWLNAIKWDEPERVVFFSNLVERHAAIARVQLELSPRRQVELAVNVAQKASERRMSIRVRQMNQPQDEFARQVDGLVCGQSVEFSRTNGVRTTFKLAWISPQRGQFIFTTRQGQESCSFAAEELAQNLREHRADVIPAVSIVDRALAAALDEIDA